jgi:phosphohistidine phosphatase
MKLILMRHGEAERHAESDAMRHLTNHGCDEVRINAEKLLEMAPIIELMAVSPYLRARETASIVSELYDGLTEQVSTHVTPDKSSPEACRDLEARFMEIETGLVVMHQPIISRLVYYLTGVEQPLGTAQIAVIQTPAPFSLSPGFSELLCVI